MVNRTDLSELRDFLEGAMRTGYAADATRRATREPDRSLTIRHEAGGWVAHDNFFGGEPYGGRLVVSHDGRPCWIGVYYGHVTNPDADVQATYDFLRRALSAFPSELPFRGPSTFNDGAWAYRAAWDGTIEAFSGRESIAFDGRDVYEAHFAGGLVDRRAGD